MIVIQNTIDVSISGLLKGWGVCKNRQSYFVQTAKGSRDHVPHFSEAPHRRTTIVSVSRTRSPQRPNRLNHPTPTDNNSSAHLQRPRCVPTTILSAVRRSTLERCVCFIALGGGREGRRKLEESISATDPPLKTSRYGRLGIIYKGMAWLTCWYF